MISLIENHNMDLLWENPNPENSFAAQNITLNRSLDNYKGLQIFFNGWAAQHRTSVISNSTTEDIVLNHMDASRCYRPLTFIDGDREKISVGGGKTDGTDSTASCIPIAIYGIKSF